MVDSKPPSWWLALPSEPGGFECWLAASLIRVCQRIGCGLFLLEHDAPWRSMFSCAATPGLVVSASCCCCCFWRWWRFCLVKMRVSTISHRTCPFYSLSGLWLSRFRTGWEPSRTESENAYGLQLLDDSRLSRLSSSNRAYTRVYPLGVTCQLPNSMPKASSERGAKRCSVGVGGVA